MEAHLGRPLLASEDVHHINGDKQDNRVENLLVIERSEHSKITNSQREYARGKKHKLSDAERNRRSEWMKKLHREGRTAPPQTRAALARARGEG